MADFTLSYTGQQVQDALDSVSTKVPIGDYEPKVATVVGSQIRISANTLSVRFPFRITATVTGSPITVSTNGGATSSPMKNGVGEDVTELEAGFYEVVYDSGFFILRSGGGLSSFFGDGSDGTIPILANVTTAPNGGNVANLWDMNAGTVFTTGTLSSASDQVVFSIDFGRPYLIPASLGLKFWGASISAGTNRNLQIDMSDDGISWTTLSNNISVSTTPNNLRGFGWADANITKRFLRVLLRSGGSNCTLSIQGVTLNDNNSSDTQTTKIFRIIEPSTLNGAAVVKQYTEYILPVGYEHTTQNPCQGLIIYSQGNATVNGILDMSQKAGLAPNGNTIPMLITKKAFKTAKTVHLWHCDSTTADDSGYSWSTSTGSYGFDTTNKKFGTAALSFNGTTQYVDRPATDDLSFGSEDFTIDFWMRPTAANAERLIFGDRGNGSNPPSIELRHLSNGALQFSFTQFGSVVDVALPQIVVNNTWYHFVSSVLNGTLLIFINGVLIYSQLINSLKRSTIRFAIGRSGEITSNYFAGQIDEFRIIKGKAMYTANFTPPTSAYTYQATYTEEPKTLEKYFQLSNVLQNLRGGYGGNGGYGGGYSGSTGRQTSVGIGGAGRQNLGGFGGGGSGGGANGAGDGFGGIGGSIEYSELGGGKFIAPDVGNIGDQSGIKGFNGSGATGAMRSAVWSYIGDSGKCLGGGGGGLGGLGLSGGSVVAANGGDGQYAGGLAYLICSGNLVINGTIRANGGLGGNGAIGQQNLYGVGGGGGGGGAGGGVIAIFHKGNYTNNGTVQVNGGAGGTGGAGSGGGEAGGSGTSGSVGTIHTQKI